MKKLVIKNLITIDKLVGIFRFSVNDDNYILAIKSSAIRILNYNGKQINEYSLDIDLPISYSIIHNQYSNSILIALTEEDSKDITLITYKIQSNEFNKKIYQIKMDPYSLLLHGKDKNIFLIAFSIERDLFIFNLNESTDFGYILHNNKLSNWYFRQKNTSPFHISYDVLLKNKVFHDEKVIEAQLASFNEISSNLESYDFILLDRNSIFLFFIADDNQLQLISNLSLGYNNSIYSLLLITDKNILLSSNDQLIIIEIKNNNELKIKIKQQIDRLLSNLMINWNNKFIIGNWGVYYSDTDIYNTGSMIIKLNVEDEEIEFIENGELRGFIRWIRSDFENHLLGYDSNNIYTLTEIEYKEEIEDDTINSMIQQITLEKIIDRPKLAGFIKQFENNREKHIALMIIENIILIHPDDMYRLLRRAVNSIKEFIQLIEYKNIPYIGVIEDGELVKSGDILRHLIKSGLKYRKLTNEIIFDNHELVIFLEDNIVSGNQSKKYLKNFLKEDRMENKDINVLLVALYAYEEGIRNIRNEFDDKIEFQVIEALSDNQRILEPKFIFREEEINEVSLFLEKYGEGNFKMGYKDSLSLVVFSLRCSNNVPNFLWKKTSGWSSLFPRFI